jgi:hypothetical protein
MLEELNLRKIEEEKLELNSRNPIGDIIEISHKMFYLWKDYRAFIS